MARIQYFLQIVAFLHIVGGLLLPFLVYTPVFYPYYQHLAQAFDRETSASRAEVGFLVGLIGPTIASWGVLFLYTVNSAFADPNPRAWWSIVIACMVWAPYDRGCSFKRSFEFRRVRWYSASDYNFALIESVRGDA